MLIEDDPKLAEHTAEYLRGHDCHVEVASDGETGLARAIAEDFDLVLLDVMLPGIDGFEVCKRLRKRSAIPVIMLTARGEEVDRVVGLEIGADDYVPKPFSPRELLARVRAVLRRGRNEPGEVEQLKIAGLYVDRARRLVSLGDTPVELTAYQFDVLWALVESAERVLTREKLYNRVRELRGERPTEFDPAVDRSVDVHVSNVRQALIASDPTSKGLIQTVRGVGYVLGRESA